MYFTGHASSCLSCIVFAGHAGSYQSCIVLSKISFSGHAVYLFPTSHVLSFQQCTLTDHADLYFSAMDFTGSAG